MKPFDLQAAINGAPIQTSCGKYLKFVAHVSVAQRGQQVVVVDALGNVTVHSDVTDTIVMTPVFKKYWVNMYKRFTGEPFFGQPLGNEHDAHLCADQSDDYIKTISFDIEE